MWQLCGPHLERWAWSGTAGPARQVCRGLAQTVRPPGLRLNGGCGGPEPPGGLGRSLLCCVPVTVRHRLTWVFAPFGSEPYEGI